MSKGQLFILSAPSGAGKSTVLQKVLTELRGVAFSVSHTTRNPRQGEREGVDYHFVSRQTFIAMREKAEFLEWAEVHGNFYGTSRGAVRQQLERGLDVILDIDVQGAEIVRQAGEFSASSIFLAPPDLAELERRLRGRGLDDEETIATRLANARREMAAMERYDYLIVNDILAEAVHMFEAVILAERARRRRNISGAPLRMGERP